MALDAPLLCYDNLLPSCSAVMRTGALESGSSLDALYNADLLRPAFFKSAITGLAVRSTINNSWRSARINMPLAVGKWYWECKINNATSTACRVLLGVAPLAQALATYAGQYATSYAYYSLGHKANAGTLVGYGAAYTLNDVIGVALDMDAGTISFYKNGVALGGAYSGLVGPLYPMVSALSPAATPMQVTLCSVREDLLYLPAGHLPIGEIAVETGTPWSADSSLRVDELRVVEIGFYPLTPVNCVIVGASRNDAAGQLRGANGLTISAYSSAANYGTEPYGTGGYGGYTLLNSVTHMLTNTAKSCLLRFNSSAALIVLRFTGCAEQLVLPEVFMGQALEMPLLDYGYDPYLEVGNMALFQAESGREYARQRYVRLEAKPRWSHVHHAQWAALDAFRERAIETRQPFWWAWMPDTYPDQVYFVRHIGASAPSPIISPNHRSFALDLQEVL